MLGSPSDNRRCADQCAPLPLDIEPEFHHVSRAPLPFLAYARRSGGRDLVRLGPVASPAQSLQIVRRGQATLRDRNNVVHLEKEMRLRCERHRAEPAGVVVTRLYGVAQLRVHQRALASSTLSEADLLRQGLDECVDRWGVQRESCSLRTVPTGTDVLKDVHGIRNADRLYRGQNFTTVSVEQRYCSLPAMRGPISPVWL